MNIELLQQALVEFKESLENAITTATFSGKTYDNGQAAKTGLIRSQKLIMLIHEVVKESIVEKLEAENIQHTIFPRVGQTSPELKISGFIKAKQQDVVVLFDNDRPIPEEITEGPLAGSMDIVGKRQSERSIIIGIRSQMSSVAKNFDTLMERAFAETLNIRLRLPNTVMGEVYLLPLVEYDDLAMVNNTISWNRGNIPVEKFINTFVGISGRKGSETENDLYKYERSALILVDFRTSPPKLFRSLDELKEGNFVQQSFEAIFDLLSPVNFAEDIIEAHKERHNVGAD